MGGIAFDQFSSELHSFLQLYLYSLISLPVLFHPLALKRAKMKRLELWKKANELKHISNCLAKGALAKFGCLGLSEHFSIQITVSQKQ